MSCSLRSQTSTSLGVKETQIPLKLEWMESEPARSVLARKTFSAPAEPQATHPIFPSPHLDAFATRQLHTREGPGLDTRQPSKGLLSSDAHIKPTLTNTHHYNAPHQLPDPFYQADTPTPGMLGLEETLDFSFNYRDVVTQNACEKTSRIDRTETEELLKQSWHVLLRKFLVSA